MFTNSYIFEYWSIFPILGVLLFSLFLIDLMLRAVSLWRAARAHQAIWFVALLCLNTMTVLPIIYLVFFAEDALYKSKQRQNAKNLPTKKIVKKTTKRKR